MYDISLSEELFSSPDNTPKKQCIV